MGFTDMACPERSVLCEVEGYSLERFSTRMAMSDIIFFSHEWHERGTNGVGSSGHSWFGFRSYCHELHEGGTNGGRMEAAVRS
jgi:hypothetical protein